MGRVCWLCDALFDGQFYSDAQQSEAEEAMKRFKDFLESRGSCLSESTEFLPYYALPYVANPKFHPTYQDLFTVSSWTFLSPYPPL